MKKIVFFAILMALSFSSYGQYRWEISGGATFSKLNLDNTETSSGTGFFFNAGYGYVMGVRAKTSIVFSLDVLQRNSEIEGVGDAKALQVGFTPKFRYLFNRGKDRFRPFINVGPSFRVNTNFEIGSTELETDAYEQIVIGGVYGVGFSQMVGEMFDIFVEAGAMNDFIDNLDDSVTTGSSKFFDVYARVGVRFRIYDARR
ncbi:outer membrane beta-barrel protein [Aquimarina sp. 2201CG5-10]|uniref:outer membrane beta-barrel protein n=1 Tax=Aquimarina callyspongiae TaxID=3098150 RepID=UPI002AB3AB5F|nr:outer membrane beta-barrel protein [Aquimarina sp. 2201CG5-10]MDY8135613.1 outer membrane beta-barrel protein [Aquimarina sp. 2201CG5-10]